MGYITLDKGAEGIVELVFDQPGSSVNTMGLEYDAAMKAAVAELQGMVAAGGVKGVYVRSGKPGQFFAGGDIKEMLEMDLDVPVERKQQMFEGTLATKVPLRTLETLGVPVAVGINGAALGGGLEIALACHHRIALAGVDLGLPEAQIGLMPGAGGVVRMTRLVGMQEAIATAEFHELAMGTPHAAGSKMLWIPIRSCRMMAQTVVMWKGKGGGTPG